MLSDVLKVSDVRGWERLHAPGSLRLRECLFGAFDALHSFDDYKDFLEVEKGGCLLASVQLYLDLARLKVSAYKN
ncbi:MAG: hypothetical protein RLZZ32_2327 [Cyanobacteriota bacterium]|jgi:hypothetical protein